MAKSAIPAQISNTLVPFLKNFEAGSSRPFRLFRLRSKVPMLIDRTHDDQVREDGAVPCIRHEVEQKETNGVDYHRDSKTQEYKFVRTQSGSRAAQTDRPSKNQDKSTDGRHEKHPSLRRKIE
jgi:hypothetical protein